MSDQHIHRPAAIPFDSDLARRADAPRCGIDRVASSVAYYAGPEIAVTAAIGGAGALVLHPLVLPVVGVLAAAHAAYAEYAARRAAKLPRTCTDTPTSEDRTTTTDTADETADDARTEEIA